MMQFNHAKLVIQWVSVGGRNFTGICSTTPQEALDIQSFLHADCAFKFFGINISRVPNQRIHGLN